MRRFGVVCLAGLLSGALSFFIFFLLLGNAEMWSVEYLEYSAVVGGSLGGAFGVVAFSICYYLFLRDVPLRISLLVTLPAMIIFLRLSTHLLGRFPLISEYVRIAMILIAGFLGLLLSSIALTRFAARAIKRA